MNKQIFNLTKEKIDKIKKELTYLLIVFVGGIIIFKMVFYKEDILNVLKMVASLFWLFLLPGYSIILYWEEKLDFLERLIIGVALGLALIGITSYYLGLAGLSIKYHTIILPLVFILVGLMLYLKKRNC
ncbi:hypothetical protein KY347_03220 [Candidatus Woesearchaeota archaeon]|nr:hypothetical protein [Candidatus Woesearchaeota archaeon]